MKAGCSAERSGVFDLTGMACVREGEVSNTELRKEPQHGKGIHQVVRALHRNGRSRSQLRPGSRGTLRRSSRTHPSRASKEAIFPAAKASRTSWAVVARASSCQTL